MLHKIEAAAGLSIAVYASAISAMAAAAGTIFPHQPDTYFAACAAGALLAGLVTIQPMFERGDDAPRAGAIAFNAFFSIISGFTVAFLGAEWVTGLIRRSTPLTNIPAEVVALTAAMLGEKLVIALRDLSVKNIWKALYARLPKPGGK